MSFRNGYKCIFAFKIIVIISKFTYEGNVNQWYLDLADIVNKTSNDDNYDWIGNKVELENGDELPKGETVFCTLTDDNIVHWFYPYSKNYYHKEIALSKLIPRKL